MVIYIILYLPALNGYIEDPLALKIGTKAISFEFFSLPALPFIYTHTNLKPKISK